MKVKTIKSFGQYTANQIIDVREQEAKILVIGGLAVYQDGALSSNSYANKMMTSTSTQKQENKVELDIKEEDKETKVAKKQSRKRRTKTEMKNEK